MTRRLDHGPRCVPSGIPPITPSKLCMAVLMVLFLGTPAPADESLESRVRALAQPYLDGEVVVGLTVGVVHKDQTLALGLGRMVLDRPDRPDGDTIYEIGSVSKVFTGILLADAVGRGEVQLDQPLQSLLPESVRLSGSGEQAISLRHLATHVSGLPRLPSNFRPADGSNPYADYTVEEMYAALPEDSSAVTPGTKMAYSNFAVGVLGYVLATAAGTNYETLLHERIAKPLQMNSTAVQLSDEMRPRLAPPYQDVGTPSSNWDMSILCGAGGIHSTAHDMIRFIQANLDASHTKLETALDLAWQVHQEPIADRDFALGLGWHIARDGKTRWHNGGTGGYRAILLVSRELDGGVFVASNTAVDELDQLGDDIMRMLAGMDVRPRSFAKPVHVAADVMQRYVGKYQLAPGFVFTVTVEGNRLRVGLSGQPTHTVYPRSDTEWYYRVVPATIHFQLDENGECHALELFQNGVQQTARRVDGGS